MSEEGGAGPGPVRADQSGGQHTKAASTTTRLRTMLAPLLDPQRWSLRMRFLYITGALLALGSVFQILFLAFTLHSDLQHQAQLQLRSLQTLVRERVAVAEQFMTAQSLAAAADAATVRALKERDPAELEALTVPLLNALRSGAELTSMQMAFADADGQIVYATTGSAAHATQEASPLLTRVAASGETVSGLTLGPFGPLLTAIAPLAGHGEAQGAVAVTVSLQEVLQFLQMQQHNSLTLLMRAEHGSVLAPDLTPPQSGPWLAFTRLFEPLEKAVAKSLAGGDAPAQQPVPQVDDHHFALMELHDVDGRAVAAVLLQRDTSLAREILGTRLYQLGGLFAAGAVVLWFILYFNVHRVQQFLSRLRKIIIASHSSDFTERFESDHVHCLEVMHCHNEECPVYKDPSRVCYLETGSLAISPQWRDTCIFLNKYDTCDTCPVYSLRGGDELAEMRNVINTMMRHWSTFLGHAGHLLSYVLRRQEAAGALPSLDDVSSSLDQMAKLTFFSHDLQGVMDKDEVYNQLAHQFESIFRLDRYVMFEVDHDTDRIFIALDKTHDMSLCKREVLLSTENCRAKRVSEDVFSFYNPVLCPYFNCDTSQDVRVCLPMVMGGQVGAVFSFLAPRVRWEKLRRDLPVIRKYLDESAPVLSSLRLLRLSKEQALRDPLTHCHNRRFLDEFISKYEPLSQREGRKTGFLMADLDYFKQVNDEYGHEAGDMVLQQVVTLIESTIRRSDLMIRYGGEEFLVLLQDVHNGKALEVAEKIRSAVDNHRFDLGDGKVLHKTISVGVSEYPEDGNALYKCIKFADVALYAAKNKGRNKVLRFEPDMWTGDAY